jgi:hypothetical protein
MLMTTTLISMGLGGAGVWAQTQAEVASRRRAENRRMRDGTRSEVRGSRALRAVLDALARVKDRFDALGSAVSLRFEG